MFFYITILDNITVVIQSMYSLIHRIVTFPKPYFFGSVKLYYLERKTASICDIMGDLGSNSTCSRDRYIVLTAYTNSTCAFSASGISRLMRVLQ